MNWIYLILSMNILITTIYTKSVFLPEIKKSLIEGKTETQAFVIKNNNAQKIKLGIVPMTKDERDMLLSGGLINYYSKN